MYLVGAVTFLKWVMVYGVAGLGLQLLFDKDLRKWKWFRMTEKRKMFTVENEHATVIGLTQHGKTYGTIKTLERMDEAILFFNTNHTSGLNNTWVEAAGGNTVDQVIYGLQHGYKINFLPSDDIKKAGKQLKAIVDEMYNLGRGAIKCRIVVDEVHLFWMMKSEEGKQANLRLATTGLGRGLTCMWLSQRPAMVDNTLYTQSTKHIIFALGLNDMSYLKNIGFPVEEIKGRTGQEKYKYCEFDQKEVKGAYMID